MTSATRGTASAPMSFKRIGTRRKRISSWVGIGEDPERPDVQRMVARACALATRLSSRVSRTIFTESLLRASHSTNGVSGATPKASLISGTG